MLWSLLFITLIGNRTTHPDRDDPGWETIKLDDKVAFQSSFYTANGVNYTADRALDGDITRCSHTLPTEPNTEPISWWTVDLLGLYEISCISIYNNYQSNIDLSGAWILIGNSSERNAADTTECATINTTTSGENKTFNCENGPKWGRYVTVYKNTSGFVILCEVTMKGRKKELPFKLIKENKTWADALYHCREEHMDLVSILDKETQGWVGLEAQKADTPFVWLGLHYSCTLDLWFWADDHCVGFDQWAPDETRTADCSMSGAMNKGGNHLWYKKSVYDKYNFICAV
ncbi:free fatty acid receptor 2 [Sarotherodon galilaeus]